MKLQVVLLMTIAGAAAGGCSGSKETPPEPLTRFEKGTVRTLSRLGLATYEAARRKAEHENTIVAPIGIGTIVSLLLEGSTEGIRQRLRGALRLRDLDEHSAATMAKAARWLSGRRGGGSIEFATALASPAKSNLRPAFREFLTSRFQASLYDPQSGALESWVRESTRGQIPWHAGPSRDRVLLMNSLYLTQSWREPFDTAEPREFHASDGSKSRVGMMTRSGPIPMRNTEQYQAARLACADADVSMFVFLPRGRATDGIERELVGKNARAHFEGYTPEHGELFMPRFRAGSKIDVAAALDLKAEDMDPIEAINHYASVAIDEKGVAGAALTVAEARSASLLMIVNRPFVFVVYDHSLELPLFLGTIATLTGESGP